MKQHYLSIQRKLMRIVLVTSGVVLFLTCAAFITFEVVDYRKSSKQQLYTLSKVVALNSTAALSFLNYNDGLETLRSLQSEPHVRAACLYDAEGHLFVKYPQSLPDGYFPKAVADTGFHYANNMLAGYQPVVEAGKRVGTLYIVSDMEELNHRLIRYLFIGVGVFIISLFLAYLISRRLQKIISRPIANLSHTASVVSEKKDYAVRAKKYDNDELGKLTEAFNDMLSQIETQTDQIKRFNYELEQKVAARTRELEKANTELVLQNDLVENVINSSVDVIAVFDQQLKYIMVNKYGCEIYNMPAEKMIGRSLLEVFPQVVGSPMHQELQQAFAGEIIHNPYYKSRISDKVLENFYIPLRDKENKIYSVLVVGHDITSAVKSTEQLKELNTQLEHSNRDLEQFAFIASHDLQEPLRKIQTFAQLALRNYDSKEEIQLYISKIVSSASRMSDLIQAVLNYSRLSNEDREFEMVDLNEVITNIAHDYELRIQEQGATIKAGNLPVIPGDPLQLNQLFVNLISNAFKFNDNKPVIEISASINDAQQLTGIDDLTGYQQYVQLTFCDNGIGFEQQYASKIFDVFQRLHNRNEYPGTGIGLALVKKIVDNHHGAINVMSEPGKGTTFNIYLPYAQPLETTA
jgi:PAS domain S-box-containing protein